MRCTMYSCLARPPLRAARSAARSGGPSFGGEKQNLYLLRTRCGGKGEAKVGKGGMWERGATGRKMWTLPAIRERDDVHLETVDGRKNRHIAAYMFPPAPTKFHVGAASLQGCLDLGLSGLWRTSSIKMLSIEIGRARGYPFAVPIFSSIYRWAVHRKHILIIWRVVRLGS